MTERIINEWLAELAGQLARHSILFVQLNSAYPKARESLREHAQQVISINDYLEATTRPGMLLISELEEWLSVTGSEFGRLRAKIYEDTQNGSQVVLLSTRPRACFPNVPGSPVLHEAKLIPPPSYLNDGFGAEAMSQGAIPRLILRDAVLGLGEAVCSDLDASFFDESGQIGPNVLAIPELDSLLSSGIAVRDATGVSWASLVHADSIREALADAIGSMRSPQPDLSGIAMYSWTVERHIKQALRARAVSLWKERWKLELVGDQELRDAALSRAQDTFPEATDFSDLRDPLEWLTVRESFRIREQPDIGDLGLAEAMWKKLESEFLPIKNRLERSQLMRKKDLDLASRWATKLSERLSTSGSENPDETIKGATETQASLLRMLRSELECNALFKGDNEKDFMSLVAVAVRFLIHTYEIGPVYTRPFPNGNPPLESDIQDAFRAFLDGSGCAGYVTNEVSSIAAGRADIVLHFNDGRRYVTETKRELNKADRISIETMYLEQTTAYQNTNVPFGHLMVLELTRNRSAHEERIEKSVWVSHRRDESNQVVSSTLVTVVRGNRLTPSKR